MLLNRTITPELTLGVNQVTLKAFGETQPRMLQDGTTLKGFIFLKWSTGEAESVHRIYVDENNENDIEILNMYIKAIQEQVDFVGTIEDTLKYLKESQEKITVLISERASEDGSKIYRNYQYNKNVINSLTA